MPHFPHQSACYRDGHLEFNFTYADKGHRKPLGEILYDYAFVPNKDANHKPSNQSGYKVIDGSNQQNIITDCNPSTHDLTDGWLLAYYKITSTNEDGSFKDGDPVYASSPWVSCTTPKPWYKQGSVPVCWLRPCYERPSVAEWIRHTPHGSRWRFNMSRNAHKPLAVTVHFFLPTTYVVRGKVHLSFYSGEERSGGRSTLDHEPPEWKDQAGRMTRSSPLSQLAARPTPFQLGLVQHEQQVWKEDRARGAWSLLPRTVNGRLSCWKEFYDQSIIMWQQTQSWWPPITMWTFKS